MDWNGAVSSARRWAAASSLGFSVVGVSEDERKISFRAPCGSFYVSVPEKIGSEEWVCLQTHSTISPPVLLLCRPLISSFSSGSME